MTNNQEAPLTNQTQFMGEEPIFESPAETTSNEGQDAQKKKSFLKTKGGKVLMIGGGILFFLVIVVLIIATKNNQPAPEQIVEKVVEEVTKEVDPLQQKIDDLREQLEEADPTKQSLAFPPVDLKLEITEK